jgi:hypothetical protein
VQSLSHSINSHSVKDRVWLKGSYTCLNCGYTKGVGYNLYYENLLEQAKKLTHLQTRNIAHRNTHAHTHTHTHTHTETHTQKETKSVHSHNKVNVASKSWTSWHNATEGIMSSTWKRIMLGKICEVTSFPPRFLDGSPTAIFMQRNNQSVIDLSLGLKQSLELKSFSLSQWCTFTHVSWCLDIHGTYYLNDESFLL